MKLSRSLSVPGPDDIPPPPETSAPEPPLPVHRRPELMYNNPTHHTQMQIRAPPTRRVSNIKEHNATDVSCYVVFFLIYLCVFSIRWMLTIVGGEEQKWVV